MKMMFGFLYALTTLNKVTKTIILSIMFELKLTGHEVIIELVYGVLNTLHDKTIHIWSALFNF
jgi:hypothetical protein